jgi:TonB family protein
MSYQALLFCPDEKTARIVTQVLGELEFRVEPCSEPFAAVKKLMAQHFDAIVVDCDNEQNAALLFKSARNSSSNQTSLSVAVVEGQAGVAKAFRLGANLVLTKPIHVEQSKATLRVARGLLRKGQATKPMATVSAFPEPLAPPPLPAPVTFPAPRASAPPVASASAFEFEAEPNPQPDTVDAALLEYMPDSPSSLESSQPSATDSTQSKQYPWQPRKPMAEPMASALRRAAEAAGKAEFENPPTSQAAAPTATSGAAAAPARARESKVTPFESNSVRPAPNQPEETSSQDQSAAEIWKAHSPKQAVDAPSFASLDDIRNTGVALQASGEGGSKKTLLVAVMLLGVAAAGYFGWTKMQARQAQPVQPSVAPAQTGTASQPPAPDASSSAAQPTAGEVVTPTPDQALTASSPVTSSSKPSAAVIGEIPTLKPSPSAKPAGTEGTLANGKTPAAASSTPAEPLVVKNGLSTQPKTEATAAEPEQPPVATSIVTGADSSALTGLVNTNAINAQKTPQQTLRISQGVSQGLIIKRVQPVYPAQAMQMRLEGTVELRANISKTGNITGIKQLSGQALLGRAATDAVRQWKYKPYYLNGEPVEVETQITVNFKLP